MLNTQAASLSYPNSHEGSGGIGKGRIDLTIQIVDPDFNLTRHSTYYCTM